MAKRIAGEVRKRAVKAPPGVACPAPGKMAKEGEGTLAAVQRERDALMAELAAAKARIAELEAVREQVVNRIAWVIDSLHNLVDE